jgi:creatinine amidohydrolase
MSQSYQARPAIALEASYKQLRELKPNVAVLPWGATEAHNFHLPCGTDVLEANAVSEAAVLQANAQGARCLLLPCVPFGINHSQLTQFAISMRSSTQQAVLRDIAESLAYQGIDRLVLMNFHGGNEFKSMIRDLAFEIPVFIVQVHAFRVNANLKSMLQNKEGDHADEFETALMLHIAHHWVDMPSADDGAMTPSELPALSSTPGVWFVRNWIETTHSSGTGDPRLATAEQGRAIFESLVTPLTKMLVELSAAQPGQYPFVHHTPIRPVSMNVSEMNT